MLFNSPAFLIFFIVVTTLYFLLDFRIRWLLLLLASCYFYMFFRPVYILILFFTIVIDYAAGILIENADSKKQKKFWLITSILANCGVLVFFKYAGFFSSEFGRISGFTMTGPEFFTDIILPVGLSFHTFQAMSYTIEVFRGTQKAERHFGIYSLYVMFYPQLVAGPIERPGHMLHQLKEKHRFEYIRVCQGLRRMLWGFFKKLVIADRLSVFVDIVYDQPEQFTGFPLIWATVFFSIQIYCDFSGYCDIALGAARVMGFNLMENFRFPYYSKSFREFWSRWHISLSSWFRDYLYIPLGGNKKGPGKYAFNILLVFAISGLWHGAAWSFIIWGILHGMFLLVEKFFPIKFQLPALLRMVLVFIFVTLAWIFFRAHSLNDALYILNNLNPSGSLLIGVPLVSVFSFVLSWIMIVLLFIVDFIIEKQFEGKIVIAPSRTLHYTVNFAMLTLIFLMGIFEEQSFIYFQF
jgi:alginate O-acetyltransferase complex protein AlgI